MAHAEETLHPQLVALIDLFEKIGLNEAEEFLLMNLLNWHNRGKGTPFSFDGLEPYVTITANGAQLNGERPDFRDRFIAMSIVEVLRKIIGQELLNQAIQDPLKAFADIGMDQASTAWLVAQLGLSTNSKDIQDSIRTLSFMGPQGFCKADIARSTISLLLQRHG